MLNELLKESTNPIHAKTMENSRLGKLRKLMNAKDLEGFEEKDIILKDKIQVIGIALYPLIKSHDLHYISLIIKKAIEHLHTSEFYTAAISDTHGGDDSLIVEILGEIKDAFLACELLVCDDLDNAKSKVLNYVLGEL
jgi:hypothetical protein